MGPTWTGAARDSEGEEEFEWCVLPEQSISQKCARAISAFPCSAVCSTLLCTALHCTALLFFALLFFALYYTTPRCNWILYRHDMDLDNLGTSQYSPHDAI